MNERVPTLSSVSSSNSKSKLYLSDGSPTAAQRKESKLRDEADRKELQQRELAQQQRDAKAKQKSNALREKLKQPIYEYPAAYHRLKVYPDDLHWKGEKAYMGTKRTPKYDRKLTGYKYPF